MRVTCTVCYVCFRHLDPFGVRRSGQIRSAQGDCHGWPRNGRLGSWKLRCDSPRRPMFLWGQHTQGVMTCDDMWWDACIACQANAFALRFGILAFHNHVFAWWITGPRASNSECVVSSYVVLHETSNANWFWDGDNIYSNLGCVSV